MLALNVIILFISIFILAQIIEHNEPTVWSIPPAGLCCLVAIFSLLGIFTRTDLAGLIALYVGK
jgi:hypothetical protein